MFSAVFLSPGRQKHSTRWRRGSPRRRNGAMLAVDANLVVRYLTGDHPDQSARARSSIDSEDVFVCTTVLGERNGCAASILIEPRKPPGRRAPSQDLRASPSKTRASRPAGWAGGSA